MKYLETKIFLFTFLPYFLHIQEVKLKPISPRFYNKPYDLNHIINKYRKDNYFNYNYDDWEDDIDYELTTQTTTTKRVTNITTVNTTDAKTDTNKNATLVTTANETHKEVTTIEEVATTILNNGTSTLTISDTNDESRTEQQMTDVTSVVNITGTASKTTISATTSEISKETVKLPETTENLLEQYTSVTSTGSNVPTFILETYFPGTTFDILNFTKPLPTTTKNPFIEELKEESHKHGYFTASLILLFKTLLQKTHKDVKGLLTALNYEVERLNREDKLLLFGGMAAEVFQSMVQMLVVEPADVMRGHLNYAVYALENKHTVLREDTNTLIDVTDTIYIEDDLDNIARVIRDIIKYPDKESARYLMDAAIEVYVNVPFGRIIGTVKERLFITELNSNLKKRLYPESVPS